MPSVNHHDGHHDTYALPEEGEVGREQRRREPAARAAFAAWAMGHHELTAQEKAMCASCAQLGAAS